MLFFDKISLGLEAKNSKSREIFFSSGCLRGDREISSHFFFFSPKQKPHASFYDFSPLCILMWAAVQYFMTDCGVGLCPTFYVSCIPISTAAPAMFSILQYFCTKQKIPTMLQSNANSSDWPSFNPQLGTGIHFCSTEICQLASLSPLRKLARLKNFWPHHQWSEVSTLFTLKSQSLNKATWCMYICTKLRAPQIRHCRIPVLNTIS